jgi:hypothetical protein
MAAAGRSTRVSRVRSVECCLDCGVSSLQIQDEVVLWQILEEAGRRIVHRESNRGPIEKINGYAWVTIRSVANSMLRQRSGQMLQRTLASEASGGALARTTATDGCKEQIEQNILIRELLAPLTPDEQQSHGSSLASRAGRLRGGVAVPSTP